VTHMDVVVVIGGSRDGYRTVDFHSKCDLTILRGLKRF
jgi:hypothetical protein